MKTIKLMLALASAAVFLNSCGSAVHFNPRNGSVYLAPAQQGGGQMMGRPQGGMPPQMVAGNGQRRVIGQKKVAHTTNLRAFVKLAGAAPQDVIDRVEQATANEVGHRYATSFEAGGKPKWPSIQEVNSIAQQKFAANGFSLKPGVDRQPHAFMVMAYRPGIPVGQQ